MTDVIDGTAHLARQTLRFGVYYAAARLLARSVPPPPERPDGGQRQRSVRMPATGDVLADLLALIREDAANVRDGLYPAMADEHDLIQWFGRMRAMFADAPAAMERRSTRDATTESEVEGAERLPEYYRQDFHFQTGGYLTEDSARLYDAQVETLFMGAAGPMRRAALAGLLHAVQGRDQRTLRILDVACGTGRLLRQMRLALPAARLTGLDLSASYLTEARSHCAGLRPLTWVEGNAEHLPFEDGGFDALTCVYLFHELPPQVRRTVAREMARVLRPGGVVVFMDSIQHGDHAMFDALLDAFPVRFHEPYFRHYTVDDLGAIFAEAGLEPLRTKRAFLSKVVVARKPADVAA